MIVNDIVSFQASLDLGEGVEILAPAELSRVASRWEWIFYKNCIYFSMAPLQLYIRVKTEFVLLAGDLDWGGRWMNLERGIRLLTQVPIFNST